MFLRAAANSASMEFIQNFTIVSDSCENPTFDRSCIFLSSIFPSLGCLNSHGLMIIVAGSKKPMWVHPKIGNTTN